MMEKPIRTYFPGTGTCIVTENADNEIYVITVECFQDLLDDWNGPCDFVPANDARVFFAAWNGEPIPPECYHDFESLIMRMGKRLGCTI